MLHVPTLPFVCNSPSKIGVEDEEVVVAKKLLSFLVSVKWQRMIWNNTAHIRISEPQIKLYWSVLTEVY